MRDVGEIRADDEQQVVDLELDRVAPCGEKRELQSVYSKSLPECGGGLSFLLSKRWVTLDLRAIR